jgi:hypothetical protein
MEKRGRTIREKNPREGHHQKFYKKKGETLTQKKEEGARPNPRLAAAAPFPLSFSSLPYPPAFPSNLDQPHKHTHNGCCYPRLGFPESSPGEVRRRER